MRIRTGYSFRSAVGMPENVIARLQACNYAVAPISDRASTFGYVEWKKAAEKTGLRPIYGIEIAVTESLNAKKPTVDYWTFFAKDNIEFINQLIELASSEGQFRYEPQLTYEQAVAAQGVFKIVGHRAKLELVSPADDIFIGLSPACSKGYINKAALTGHSFIACSDNKFTLPEDRAMYEVICGRGASTQSYPQYILDEKEWKASVKYTATPKIIKDALHNFKNLPQYCTAQLTMGEMLTPEKPKTMLQMCIEGAEKLGVDISDPVYAKRMEHELKMIHEKGFDDYFYIIADAVQWARKNMIVGPARGSSCGSLVCYLLQITTIDPLKYDLIFERFIDVNREDLPDIDIDFSDQKRQLVFDYMEKKYGAAHVARLGTVALYKPKSAINEAGAALGVPTWLTEKALDSLIQRSSADARAHQTIEDTFTTTAAGKDLMAKHPEISIAMKMEGHPRHHSQHAAGIILTQGKVSKYVAIDSRTGATHCNKKDAESLNLLKIDALGLTQLSVFEDALELAGLPHTHLETIPLDDKAAFAVLNKKQFSGIFQFNGPALQYLISEIEVDELEDFIAITALARPGPMNSGEASRWTRLKRGDISVVYPHSAFEPYLKNSRGVIIYQEQVMEICRNIGNLSWADVGQIRSAMARSKGVEFFNSYGAKFKEGAAPHNIPPEVLDKIWDGLCAYGSWSFNRSHAVAYGIVSYQCCWLKAHYPLEFAAATLSHEVDPDKQIQILREMEAEGIGYVPVDINLSTDRWRVGEHEGVRKLIGPVQNVKGIGPKLCQQIVSCRARGEVLPARAEKLLTNPKTEIDSLWPIKDRFAEIMPNPVERNIYTSPQKITNVKPSGNWQNDVLIFGVAYQIKPRDENEELRLQRRGHKIEGLTDYLELRMRDDSGIIYCRIGRNDFPTMGREIIERGRVNKSMYAIKGTVPPDFRMILIKNIRYIGDLENDIQA